MNLNVLLSDMLAAVLAPIVEGILSLFAAFASLVAEILTPVLAPIFAPIVEVIVWVYLTLFAAFSQLVWGLVGLAGLARHARGVSFAFFALAIAGTVYLLTGIALVFVEGAQDVLSNAYSTKSVLFTFASILVAAAIGSCLRNDPSAPKPKERTDPPDDAPPISTFHTGAGTRPGAYLIGVGLTIGVGIMGLWIYNNMVAEPEKRPCTKTETAIIVAERLLASRSDEKSNFDTEGLKCRLP